MVHSFNVVLVWIVHQAEVFHEALKVLGAVVDVNRFVRLGIEEMMRSPVFDLRREFLSDNKATGVVGLALELFQVLQFCEGSRIGQAKGFISFHEKSLALVFLEHCSISCLKKVSNELVTLGLPKFGRHSGPRGGWRNVCSSCLIWGLG